MKRADDSLAFLLQYENVAWYEDGQVRILDRRIYPMETRFVVCSSYTEVALAIAGMVTQSGGPFTAAAMGMALASYEARALPEQQLRAFMQTAAHTLAHARPTTQRHMSEVTNGALAVMEEALAQGTPAAQLPEVLFRHALALLEARYRKYTLVGQLLAAKIPPGGTVMTQCFGETVVGTMLRALREEGRTAQFICPETRPFLQGARLTASVIHDMGFPVHVITDNMPACIMKEKKVDLFTSAADVITMDGHVVNKVGTFQIALAAHYWGIPYFVTGTPSQVYPSAAGVRIEERDAGDVLEYMGRRATLPGVGAYYPAFDITPPHLCSGVVTDRGVFSPFDLAAYFV